MDYLMLAVIGFVVLCLGGGGGYWIWISTRPKKLIWKAKIYQLGDGILPPVLNKGKMIANYRLADLKPFCDDVVEKVDNGNKGSYYWLQKLQKSVPVVTADCIEKWNEGELVKVLLEGDTCTLLKSGYDKNIGKQIFFPMPHERINMIKTEITERLARVDNKKDILLALTPFIVIGIAMLALVAIAYIDTQAALKINEINNKGFESTTRLLEKITTIYTDECVATNSTDILTTKAVEKGKPPNIPP